jgi:hypothetical protein
LIFRIEGIRFMTEPISFLLRDLNEEQTVLVETLYEGFELRRGAWPVWQFVDLRLEARKIDAAAVLASLPQVGAAGAREYGLVWSGQNMANEMQSDAIVGLTVAGLRHVQAAGPLVSAFVHLLRLFGEAEQEIVPAPDREVQATVTSEQVTASVLRDGTLGQSRPPVHATVLKLHGLLSHEPYNPWTGLSQSTGGDHWEVRLSNRLGLIRALRDTATVEDYVAFVEDWLKPHPVPVVPHVINALDLPNAADYLDVVWKIKTGRRLFKDLHLGSCARLTQTCDSEDRFNSLTSALAEVLSSVVPPRRTSPGDKPLHTLHELLPEVLPPENVARGQDAIAVLLKLTLIRNAQQHSSARDRALRAVGELGIALPTRDWGVIWGQMATLAREAFDALREEMQTLPDSSS